MSAVLQTRNLVKTFGGITATDDITFSLEKGARHALIGPNGAGKTTFVNLLTGVLQPTAGAVILNGEDITTLSREARVKRGMARTFQINQLFATMTPLQMIALVTSERLGYGLRAFNVLDHDPRVIEQTADILARFRLEDIMNETIASLPYGKQRQVELRQPLRRSRVFCCSMSRLPVCRRLSGVNCSTLLPRYQPMSPCC